MQHRRHPKLGNIYGMLKISIIIILFRKLYSLTTLEFGLVESRATNAQLCVRFPKGFVGTPAIIPSVMPKVSTPATILKVNFVEAASSLYDQIAIESNL